MANTIQMITSNKVLNYSFELQRKTGKNYTLSRGNMILNSNDRMQFFIKSQISNYLRQLSYDTVLASEPTFDKEHPRYNAEHPCTILVTVYSPTKRRIDAPNLYPTVKALIDGMTDAGLWSDDNNTIIQLMGFVYGGMTTTKKYQIDITISDMIKNEQNG